MSVTMHKQEKPSSLTKGKPVTSNTDQRKQTETNYSKSISTLPELKSV